MISNLVRGLGQGLRTKNVSWQKVTVKGLATLLFVVISTQSSAERYSPIVSFSGRNVPLRTVLKSFEKQTGLTFFYNNALIKDLRPVTVEFKSVPLEEALTQLLKNASLEFYESGRTIFIVKKNENLAPSLNVLPSTLSEKISVEVKGRVTNQRGEILAGATVVVRNTNKLTLTDQKGMFELKNIPLTSTLEITYQGYQRKDVQASEDAVMEIQMTVAENKLDEVQVIAYGSTSARLNVGNVTTVKAAEIEKQPVNNPLLALEGQVPGLFILQTSGYPGTGVQILLRGLNSISNGITPLYIIDGVPYSASTAAAHLFGESVVGSSNDGTGNPFDYINPGDIESINVLKDADATAIYGSRGANGVILITTKRGKQGSTRVDVNYQSGVGMMAEKMHLLTTQQYLLMRHEAFANDIASPNASSDFDLTLWDTARNIDWQNVLLGGKDKYDDAQGTISGGNENTQFLFGAGFHRETTVFPVDFHDEKGSIHFNLNNTSSNKRFKVSFTGLYMVDKNILPITDPTTAALTLSPDAPSLWNRDRSINWVPGPSGNSSWPSGSIAALLSGHDNVSANNLVANGVISYLILPGLEIKSSLGYTNSTVARVIPVPLTMVDPAIRQKEQRQSSFSNGASDSWVIEPQLVYTRNIMGGVVNALIGTTIEKDDNNGQALQGKGYSSDEQLNSLQAATTVTLISTEYSMYRYNAAFGRLAYNLHNKYLINLTSRRDGSSRFGPENQFHDFWSAGAGWIFSSENFIRKALPVLSYGKVRASYGTTGSDQVGDYTFMDLYSTISNISLPYQGTLGIYPTRIFTPNLAWEKTAKAEGGLELGFFNDRILLNGSFYLNRSSNQLIGYALPSISGFSQVSRNLDAVLQNKGWELTLQTVNISRKAFRWTTNLNVSINHNKLVSGAPGLSSYLTEKIGHPINVGFFYHYLGVDPITGVNQFADVNGKPTDNPNPNADMTQIVDPSPGYLGGLKNTITYRGFQLDFLFQFVQQPHVLSYISNFIPGYFGNNYGGNQPVGVLTRWRKPGDVTMVPRFSENYSLLNSFYYGIVSDHDFSDGSYFRLKNASIYWQLPPKWRTKASLENAKLFIQGQNLLMITKYKGLDPESMTSSNLPPLRVITAGVVVSI